MYLQVAYTDQQELYRQLADKQAQLSLTKVRLAAVEADLAAANAVLAERLAAHKISEDVCNQVQRGFDKVGTQLEALTDAAASTQKLADAASDMCGVKVDTDIVLTKVRSSCWPLL